MPLSNASEFPLWVNACIFMIAAVAVWSAGTRLTHYLDGVAKKTGMGQAFAGMLLLGGITSLPEIANVLSSASAGNPRLAINNLLGSASINIVLLAVADAFIRRDAVTSVVAKPSTMMMAALCMVVLVSVAVAITTGDLPVFGIGAWSLVLCVMSVGAFWLASGYDKRAPWRLKFEPARRKKETEYQAREALSSLVKKSAVAGAVLFAAGYTLSQTGDALAEQTGVGSGMMGFALIGFSTSLPELSSIVTALRIRRYEMAFGQILGTNFVNLSLILLADAVFAGGPVINELGRFEVIAALLGALLTGTFLIGLLEHRNPTILRMGYDSLAVMILFGLGLVFLYTVQ